MPPFAARQDEQGRRTLILKAWPGFATLPHVTLRWPARSTGMTLKRSLVLILLQLLFVFVLGFMVVGPHVFPNPENMFQPSLALAIFLLVATLFGAIGLVWYGSVKSVGRTWRELGWHTDQLGAQVVLGIAGAAV